MNKTMMYSKIDLTCLKPTADYWDIFKLCEKAEKNNIITVCVPPYYVNLVSKHFPHLDICTVIGFPFGYTTIEAKIAEAKKALEDGAEELDIVINLAELQNGNYEYIQREIDEIINALPYNPIVKIIVETCYLDKVQLEIITKIVDDSKATYIKTSTGYGTRGASFEDIKIIRNSITNKTLIKASGGIRTLEEVEQYIKLGCDRIGMSEVPK